MAQRQLYLEITIPVVFTAEDDALTPADVERICLSRIEAMGFPSSNVSSPARVLGMREIFLAHWSMEGYRQ